MINIIQEHKNKELVQSQLQDIQNFSVSVLPEWLQKIYQDVTDELIQIVAKDRAPNRMHNYDYFKDEYANIRCGLMQQFIKDCRREDPTFIPYLFIKKSLLEEKKQEHEDLQVWYEQDCANHIEKIRKIRNNLMQRCFFLDLDDMNKPIQFGTVYVIVTRNLLIKLHEENNKQYVKNLFDVLGKDRLKLVVAFNDNDTEIPESFYFPGFCVHFVITGAKLTHIAPFFSAENNNDYPRSIDLPDGITTISGFFCRANIRLQNIHLPSKLVNISINAFVFCISLTNLKIPYGVKKIEERFCIKNTGLKNIEFPYTLETLGKYAFMESDTLESIVIPEKFAKRIPFKQKKIQKVGDGMVKITQIQRTVSELLQDYRNQVAPKSITIEVPSNQTIDTRRESNEDTILEDLLESEGNLYNELKSEDNLYAMAQQEEDPWIKY